MFANSCKRLLLQRPVAVMPRARSFFTVGTDPSRKTVTLIRGDGIGPEVTNSVVQVLAAMKAPIDWETYEWDVHTGTHEKPIPQDLEDSINRNKFAIKGPSSASPSPHVLAPDIMFGRNFDLFAHVVPIKTNPAITTRHNNVDMVVIRENTEGEYSGLEHSINSGVVQSLKVITEAASRRVAEYAFEYAVKHGRKKVSAVHKANIMKRADGLFLKCCREVAGRYRNKIEYDEVIIDNCCMQLVSKPEQFDVMVTTNLYGNIVSEAASGLAGGVGISPGFNTGNKVHVYEQGCRHTGMDIASMNLANPTGLLLSAAIMLDDMGLTPYAKALREAIKSTIESGDKSQLTRDIKQGEGSTSSFTQAVIDNLSLPVKEEE